MVFRQREKLIKTLICIGIVAATFVAYEPIRHNDFIGYDDPKYITKNPNVTGGITRQSVIWALTKPYSANWHPLTWVSHMLDCQLFGLNPFRHHLVSVLFHIANALLLFWILTNMTGTIWPSAFAAAVFALHPLHVESVAWAAERKDVLSGLFWMLTMAAYIWYARRPGTGRYVLLLLVYGLSIMTKPVVVTLPLALLLLDYWPLGRLQLGQPVKAGQKLSLGRLITEKIPLLALAGILSVITIIAQRSGGAVVTLEKNPLDYRIANALLSYAKYIGKTLWPSQLAVYYPHPHASISDAAVIAAALLLILITAVCIYTGRRRKYIAMGWLWYIGTLVPMTGLVQVGNQGMADRYMYIPMLGLLIIIAWAVKDFVVNRPRWKIVAVVLAAAVSASLILLTRTQVRYWENDLTLFGHTVKVTENNALAENNYGCALLEAGRVDEALPYLSDAVRLAPTLSGTRANIGKIFLKKGKPNEAIACFNELLRQNEGSAETHYCLALALGMQNKYDEAIKHLAKTLELDPNYPDTHNRMGVALMATGKTDEAIAYFNEATRISSEQTEAFANLGMAYTQLGKYEPAIQNLTKAAELKSDNIYVLNNLAWLLATGGNVSANDANKAIEFARRACELTGYKITRMLDTLAAAYAAGGRFDEAVRTAEQAVNIAKNSGQKDIADEIQKRVELYKAGKRYIQK